MTSGLIIRSLQEHTHGTGQCGPLVLMEHNAVKLGIIVNWVLSPHFFTNDRFLLFNQGPKFSDALTLF